MLFKPLTVQAVLVSFLLQIEELDVYEFTDFSRLFDLIFVPGLENPLSHRTSSIYQVIAIIKHLHVGDHMPSIQLWMIILASGIFGAKEINIVNESKRVSILDIPRMTFARASKKSIYQILAEYADEEMHMMPYICAANCHFAEVEKKQTYINDLKRIVSMFNRYILGCDEGEIAYFNMMTTKKQYIEKLIPAVFKENIHPDIKEESELETLYLKCLPANKHAQFMRSIRNRLTINGRCVDCWMNNLAVEGFHHHKCDVPASSFVIKDNVPSYEEFYDDHHSE